MFVIVFAVVIDFVDFVAVGGGGGDAVGHYAFKTGLLLCDILRSRSMAILHGYCDVPLEAEMTTATTTAAVKTVTVAGTTTRKTQEQ